MGRRKWSSKNCKNSKTVVRRRIGQVLKPSDPDDEGHRQSIFDMLDEESEIGAISTGSEVKYTVHIT